MKKIKIITSLLLLILPVLVYSQQITFENNNLKPDRSMQLEILDKNEQPVIDAQLSVNGFTALYKAEIGKYVLLYKDERTYHLKISHPDYLPVGCELPYGIPNRFYLLKDGESYRYEYGLHYPVNDNPHLLYVTRKTGNTLKADSMIALQFEHLLDSLQLEVHYPMDAFIKKKEPPFHQAPVEHLKHSYIITTRNGTFQMNGNRCIELEALRNFLDLVAYAGPLISNKSDFSDATLYIGHIGVNLKLGENWEKFIPSFESFGLNNLQPTISEGRVSFYLKMPGILLKDITSMLETIHALKGVENVAAYGIAFFTFHE